jgi:class 3 adenylate cyclase
MSNIPQRYDTPPVTHTSAENAAEHRQVTVMWIGLFDSTTSSAHVSLLKEAISAYQQRIVEVMRFYDGSVLKNLNDGVLACFGYPMVQEDQAERAVLAGMQMIRAVAEIMAPVSLLTRVGIATGIVAVDDFIGSSGLASERDIVGEALRLAAIRSENTGPNTIVIGERTLKLLGNSLKSEDLTTKDLKGTALRQIVEIAEVPPERRATSRIQIVDLMIDFIREHEKLHDPKFLAEAEEQIKHWKTELMQLAKARSSIATAILKLKSAIAKFDEEYGEADRCVIAPQPIETLLSELEKWVDGAPPIVAILAERRKGRGRPSQPTHRHFFHFLCLLLATISAEGGKLTFDKNYPTRGTLVRALDLLRPHMPRGFIPEKLPIRVLIRARKISAGGLAAVAAFITQDLGRLQNLNVIERIAEGRERNGK